MVASDRYEKELWGQGFQYICGLDECGTGAYCADAACCALIFPRDLDYKTLLPGLNDSKQKTPEQREALYPKIKQYALDYVVEFITVEEIDRLNVYWAKFLAIQRAIDKLTIKPDYLLMDGNKEVPGITVPQKSIVRGDSASISIAAASILCKVDRDHYMSELGKKVHPDYEWAENKGYHCKATLDALKKHGPTPWHRKKWLESYYKKQGKV
jgi:ribonuclease HII